MDQAYAGEFSTGECKALLDNIAQLCKPIIILTGGEPMLRPDIYEIARYGHDLGMRMVMAPCGQLVDAESVAKMVAAGIECISLSLDGDSAASHDEFRNTPGAFDSVMRAAAAARSGGLSFQINTTVTRDNLEQLPGIMKLATSMGAVTFNPFLLVTTGRGSELAGHELTPEQYEHTLQWLAEHELKVSDTFNSDTEKQVTVPGFPIRVTCGPQYQRIIRQCDAVSRASDGLAAGHCERIGHGGHRVNGSGCMGGKSFAFISHTGSVQICGFLDISAGQINPESPDFVSIWQNSDFLTEIRNVDNYHGKCGMCEYRHVCGGCRARAFAASGDYLGDEPMCDYKLKSLL